MGILTDPSLTKRNQLGRSLVKHNRKICAILYLAGAVWFCCLGYKNFNHATYLSENALSPGLVYSEIRVQSAKYAQSLLEELNRERETHRSGIPYAWLMAKFRQIGLDTFTHNFTLNYPLGGGKVYRGKNVYGILRAPRIGSTEGVVYSAPYRPPDSVHADITASIPILLSFAEFARKRNYWAKDLIFLVTDLEQLGMHAWLEAYYKGGMEYDDVLDVGDLEGRAGSLQAALNLEIQGLDVDYVDVKIEGINGYLPNLDMFNLVQRLTARENLISGYKHTPNKKRSASLTTVQENIMHMLSMIFTQANGVPTGNHGMFHRYRIESLTLEAVKAANTNYHKSTSGALNLLRTVEGISRSLNNLLERFHQSYFFYILVANDRFVSIGDFTPSLMLMAGPLFIKAFLLWLKLDDETDKSIEDEKEEKKKQKKYVNKGPDMQYTTVATVVGVVLALGVLSMLLPINVSVNKYLASKGLSTETIISLALVFTAVPGFILPFFIDVNPFGLELLHIATLLYLGSALIVVGLLNFSLGFILSTIAAPLAIILDTKAKKSLKRFTIFYTILLHPLAVVYLVVLIVTLNAFPELTLQQVAFRASTATMDALTFAAVDSIIYKNWLYIAGTVVFFPAWILLWCVNFIKANEVIPTKLKTN